MRQTFSKQALSVLAAAMLSILSLFAATPAAASPLDDYRAAGVIVERFDGRVEAINNAPAAAKALVTEVNAKRMEIYTKRAQDVSAPVEEIGKVYAKEILKKAPAGTVFKDAAGKLTKK